MRGAILLLALVGSTFAVACAATPAPDGYENDQASSGRSSKKKTTKSTDDDTDESSAAAPASTTDVSDRPPPAEDVPAAPAAPVQASDTIWVGTLAKTAVGKFGGTPYCEYQTHMENLNVKVVIGADGKVKSASVTGQAVEEALNNCPNNAIPPNLHAYTLATEATGTTFTVDGGGSAAEPHAKMDANVSASGATGSVVLKFQRNDQTAPLVWTINTTVPLTKQ